MNHRFRGLGFAKTGPDQLKELTAKDVLEMVTHLPVQEAAKRNPERADRDHGAKT